MCTFRVRRVHTTVIVHNVCTLSFVPPLSCTLSSGIYMRVYLSKVGTFKKMLHTCDPLLYFLTHTLSQTLSDATVHTGTKERPSSFLNVEMTGYIFFLSKNLNCNFGTRTQQIFMKRLTSCTRVVCWKIVIRGSSLWTAWCCTHKVKAEDSQHLP